MWRRLIVEDDTGLTGYAGKHRVHLPRTRTIGAVELTVQGVNGSSHNSADAAEQEDIRKAITNLTIKSGAKVFYNTNGFQNRNIMTYDQGGVLPHEVRTQVGGASQYALFTMPFWIEPMARLADGSGMGLPAPLLNSLDLDIEYAFAQSSDAGFASTGHKIDVAVWLYDYEELVPQLEAKQFRVIDNKFDYTSKASGDEPFGLTLDPMRMLRRIYVEAYKVSVAEAGIISDIRVKRDNDEIYNGKWNNIQSANASHCGLNWEQYIATWASSTTDVIYTRVPNAIHKSFTAFGATERDDTEYVTTLANGVYTLTQTDDKAGYLTFKAQEIPTMAVVDWDLLKDLGDMVPQTATSLELILTNAAADGTVKIAEESITRMWV